MANSHLPITCHIAACKLLLLSLHLLLVAGRLADVQSSDETSDDGNNAVKTPSKFHPIRPLLIAVIIGTVAILLVYTFYIRRWRNERLAALDLSAALFPSSRQRGLDTAVLDSFPTMLYSDVKGHKIGKGELECAVCLNEFGDDDSLRLLPKCSHVFHEDCIDAWLAKHVTCPVCRADLEGPGHGPQEVAAEHVEVAVEEAEEERRREMKELASIASRTRRRSVSRQKRLLRWNTTGHIAEDLERYTLRLPENVRNDIVVARRLQRERSVPARSTDADQDGIAAGKIWRRGGETGGSRRPSFRRVLSARWPSFLLRPQQ